MSMKRVLLSIGLALVMSVGTISVWAQEDGRYYGYGYVIERSQDRLEVEVYNDSTDAFERINFVVSAPAAAGAEGLAEGDAVEFTFSSQGDSYVIEEFLDEEPTDGESL